LLTIDDDDAHVVAIAAVPPTRPPSLVSDVLPIVPPTTVTLAAPVDTTFVRVAPLGVGASQLISSVNVLAACNVVAAIVNPADVPAVVLLTRTESATHNVLGNALCPIRTRLVTVSKLPKIRPTMVTL
jgi:hypothetical protein